MNFTNSNCDETQTEMVTKFKNLICDKTRIVTKLKL